MSFNGDVFEPIPKSNAKQRAILVEWLNSLLPNVSLPLNASDEDLRAFLADGTVLCQILSKLKPGSVAEYGGPFQTSDWQSENVKRFLTAMENMGMPTFQLSDLEKGSMKSVIECLLTLRSRSVSNPGEFQRSDSYNVFGNDGTPKWKLFGDFFRLNSTHKEEQTRGHSSLRSPVMAEPSAALMHHVGHKFHEVFQLKNGRYADLPASKISEMMKSNSLDNAPTQSLLSVVNGILDESVERKSGEIPHRVALLLRKVVQEIERRISTQAEHFKTQNNLFKAREDKYQSRIRLLEALANRASEETEIAMNYHHHHQQQQPQNDWSKNEEKKKAEEQDAARLMKERDDHNKEIAALKQELEAARRELAEEQAAKLIKEKDDHNKEIAALKQELETAALKQELEAARRVLGEEQAVKLIKEKDNDHHNKEIAALKQELEAARRELAEEQDAKLIKERDDHNKEIAVLRQELEAAALKQELEAARRELGEEQAAKLIKEKDDHNKEIEALKQELEAARRELGEEQDVKLIKEKDDHNKEIAVLKQELEAAALKQELEAARRELGEEQAAKLIKEKDDHNKEIAALKHELEAARRELDEEQAAKLIKERDDHKKEIAALKQELEAAMRELAEQHDSTRLMKEKDNDHQNKEITALKQELESARRELAEEHDATRLMKEKGNDNHSKEIAALKQELESARRELDATRLTKEKDNDDHNKEIAALKQELEAARQGLDAAKQELEAARKTNEKLGLQMEIEARGAQQTLQDRMNEFEKLLADSKHKVKELEAASELQLKGWNKKEHIYQIFSEFQLGALRELRFASQSIKQEIVKAQKGYSEEFNSLGMRIKALQKAAENYHSMLAENQKLHNELQELKGNIRVYCRIRPLSKKEKQTIVEYIGENGDIVVVNPAKQGKESRRSFKFNKVYGQTATQVDVFSDTQPLIQSVLDGYNVCIFAYGQTGSGKTYTMSGPDRATEAEWGVNYRALNNLFQISQNRESTFSYEISVQMVEIYNEQVRDLLSSDGSQKRLGILTSSKPNGLAVPDACQYPVKETSDVMHLMDVGMKNRAKSSTALNERSSRSHSILSIHVRGVDQKAGSSMQSSLHLVDLAGSERVDRSEVTGDRLKEAQHINKSLAALGDVISALALKSPHVPYRNSKLTQVLQSSLGGNAKTLMFVQVNPEPNSYSESVSTLKFAERVSGIELGAAKSNKDGRDVRDLMEQVASLKDTIANKDEEIERLQLNTHPGANNEGHSLRN